jgi:aryl-alcohol dehydrogenase-like predicted oxidoreductase
LFIQGANVKYNQLGRTGLFVSEMCLGTMTFGGNPEGGSWSKIGALQQTAVESIVARALACGVNFVDTADVYANGQSEQLLGQALKNLRVARKDVVIATKVAGETGRGPNDRGASRGHIMDAVRASLERLQVEYIDLYQIHAADWVTPIDEILRALDDLTSEGLVRYFGVSNWPAWRVARALGRSELNGYGRFETLQAYYTMVSRDIEREIVPLLMEERIGLLVWSPLAGGLLSGKFGPGIPMPTAARRTSFGFPPVDLDHAWPCIAEMRKIGDAHGVSVARIALAWLLAKPHVTSVIVGAKTLSQLDDNLAAADLTLTASELAALDEVGTLKPEYPGLLFSTPVTARRIPRAFTPGKSQ